MEWSRLIRLDRVVDDGVGSAISAELAPFGATIQLRANAQFGRTYALIEGLADADPAEVAVRIDATWFDEPIIALAIEPEPADALPLLCTALAGPGGLAGVASCDAIGKAAVVEFVPAKTSLATIMQIVDAELHRFHGYRRCTLLSPLPASTVAAIAADGLAAPEIGADRILEILLERAGVA